jgi:hypothetical protein
VSPESNLLNVIDNTWNNLDPGWIIYNPPDEMKVGIEELIETRITRNITKNFEKDLKGRGKPQLDNITVAGRMKPTLIGYGSFNITPQFPPDAAEQAIVNEFAEWDWTVLPLRGGNQTLRLCVDAIIEIPAYKDRHYLRVYDRLIKVQVNPVYTFFDLLEKYWLIVLGLLGLSGIIAMKNWIKSILKKIALYLTGK